MPEDQGSIENKNSATNVVPSDPADIQKIEFPSYRRGKWWPAFALLILPFVVLAMKLYRTVKDELNWRATIVTLLIFEVYLFCGEYHDLQRGHWVYNESRILGPKILHVPIEEPLIYYWFPPFLSIVMMLVFRKKIQEQEEKP